VKWTNWKDIVDHFWCAISIFRSGRLIPR